MDDPTIFAAKTLQEGLSSMPKVEFVPEVGFYAMPLSHKDSYLLFDFALWKDIDDHEKYLDFDNKPLLRKVLTQYPSPFYYEDDKYEKYDDNLSPEECMEKIIEAEGKKTEEDLEREVCKILPKDLEVLHKDLGLFLGDNKTQVLHKVTLRFLQDFKGLIANAINKDVNVYFY